MYGCVLLFASLAACPFSFHSSAWISVFLFPQMKACVMLLRVNILGYPAYNRNLMIYLIIIIESFVYSLQIVVECCLCYFRKHVPPKQSLLSLQRDLGLSKDIKLASRLFHWQDSMARAQMLNLERYH